VALYAPQIGRCSDGLTDGGISPHCGAESSIEAGFVEMARQRLLESDSPRAGRTLT
jgi:hypothetical protein